MSLHTLGAAAAARGIRARELSSTELVRALLDRIDEVDPRVRATRQILAEEALRAAADADRRLSEGAPAGPLDGVPFTVKDNIDVAGSATTQGVRAFAEAIAPVDAPAVAHLRRAGAIPLARTNMPDFALRWHTDSEIAGPTLNPWDPALTPGGSSGGEAVALATGMTPLGVGNDLGGSLRWPAQCNGIASLRPTLGRIPHALSFEPTAKPLSLQFIEVQGPMARRVEDLRPAFGLMCALDPRDPWHVALPADHAPTTARVVCVADDLPGLDPPVRAALAHAATALEEHGYELADRSGPPLEAAAALWPHIMSADNRRLWPQVAPLASPDAGALHGCRARAHRSAGP
jgi:amidase